MASTPPRRIRRSAEPVKPTESRPNSSPPFPWAHYLAIVVPTIGVFVAIWQLGINPRFDDLSSRFSEEIGGLSNRVDSLALKIDDARDRIIRMEGVLSAVSVSTESPTVLTVTPVTTFYLAMQASDTPYIESCRQVAFNALVTVELIAADLTTSTVEISSPAEFNTLFASTPALGCIPAGSELHGYLAASGWTKADIPIDATLSGFEVLFSPYLTTIFSP